MKLSEVKGERVFDVIADIVEPVVAIATSDEFKALFDQSAVAGMDEGAVKDHIVKSIPALIRNHREEAVTILAAIGGVSREEYVDSMTFPSLLADVTELMTDDVFTDFLSSASPMVGQAQSTSD
jgi:hypothetical protein